MTTMGEPEGGNPRGREGGRGIKGLLSWPRMVGPTRDPAEHEMMRILSTSGSKVDLATPSPGWYGGLDPATMRDIPLDWDWHAIVSTCARTFDLQRTDNAYELVDLATPVVFDHAYMPKINVVEHMLLTYHYGPEKFGVIFHCVDCGWWHGQVRMGDGPEFRANTRAMVECLMHALGVKVVTYLDPEKGRFEATLLGDISGLNSLGREPTIDERNVKSLN